MSNKQTSDNSIVLGSVDLSLHVTLVDISSGSLKQGLVAADLTCYYVVQGGSPTQITLSNLALFTSAHSDGGIKEAGSTMPGLYRLDLPDAFQASGDHATLYIYGGSIQTYIKQFALHSFTAETSTGAVKVQSGTGANQISLTSGIPAVNVTQCGGSVVPASAIPNAAAGATGGLPVVNSAGGVLVRDGTGTGELNLTNGNINIAGFDTDSITAASVSSDAANKIADALLARTLGTEAYATLGSVPTVKQAFFQLIALWTHVTTGTTVSMKKLDQSTTAFTYTLSPNATTPTSVLRSS